MTGAMNIPEFAEIIEQSARMHLVAPQDILSKSRTRTVSRARRWAMRQARLRFGWSYPELGKAFDRDHTTVLYACLGDAFREEKNMRKKFRNAMRP